MEVLGGLAMSASPVSSDSLASSVSLSFAYLLSAIRVSDASRFFSGGLPSESLATFESLASVSAPTVSEMLLVPQVSGCWLAGFC